jgi:hypothetical protein
VRGVGFNFSATKTYGRAELYIDRGEREENLFIFDSLLSRRNEIEDAFDGELVWERLDGKQACRIKAEGEGNIFDRARWTDMIDYMTDAMVRLEKAMARPLSELNVQLKTRLSASNN